jgi:hypothetical protein
LALDNVTGLVLRHAGTFGEVLAFSIDELRFRLCGLWREPSRFLGAQFTEFRLFDDPERRTGSEGVQQFTVGWNRATARLILRQWWLQYRRTFKYKALRSADYAVHNTAFEQLATDADHRPAQLGKPAARV